MRTPHKHAELIKLWADGAEIQYKTGDFWVDCPNNFPHWMDDCEYRIKPEEKKPVVRWLWAYLSNAGLWRTSMRYMTEKEANNTIATRIKLEWSRTEFPE